MTVNKSDAAAGRPGWKLIENEGALFRGFGCAHPQEVWTPGKGWRRYAEAGKFRPVEWGNIVSETEAFELMVQLDGRL